MSSNCLATIGRTYKFIAKSGLHGERCRPFIFLKMGRQAGEIPVSKILCAAIAPM